MITILNPSLQESANDHLSDVMIFQVTVRKNKDGLFNIFIALHKVTNDSKFSIPKINKRKLLSGFDEVSDFKLRKSKK